MKLTFEEAIGKLMVNLDNRPKNFVFLAKDLPAVGPKYSWNNYDKVYEEYGNYVTETKNEKLKTGKRDLLSGSAGFFVEGDIHKENGNSKKKGNNEKADVDIEKKFTGHNNPSDSLSNLMASIKKNIAPIISIVNQTIDQILNGKKFGTNITSPINPADKLVNNAENTLIPDLEKNKFINKIIADEGRYSNQMLLLMPAKSAISGQGSYDRAYEEYGTYITQSSKIKAQNYNSKAKSEEDLLSGGTGFFVEGDIHKENNNQKQRISDTYFNINISPIDHMDSSSNLTANINERIPITRLNVNNRISFGSLIANTFGSTTSEPVQPADRLVKNPDNTLNHDLVKDIFIKTIYAQDNILLTDLSTIRGVPFHSLRSLGTTSEVSSGLEVYYPFRSLFTGRRQEELEFGVEKNSDYFSFRTKIPKELVGYKLIIPKLEEKEITAIDENDLSKKSVRIPEIYLDGEVIQIPPPQGSPSATPGVSLSPSVSHEVSLGYINEGNLEVRAPKIKGYYSYDIEPRTINLEPRTCDQFNKGVYKHDYLSNNLLRLTSIGSSNCLDIDLPNLSHNLSYLVTIENRNIEGKSLLFSVINKNSQRADIETYLPKNSPGRSNFVTPSRWPNGLLEGGLTTSYFVIPPMEEYGLGYTLHFDNISIGRVKTVNDLGKITVNPIPYRFLTSLKIVKWSSDSSTSGESINATPGVSSISDVDHPNPSFYQVSLDSSTVGGVHADTSEVSLSPLKNTTLILSQSFDDGWKAYELKSDSILLDSWYMKLLIPFFQPELKDHVLVNNWENGWRLSDNRQQTTDYKNTTIVIIYLPQYLQYLGFLLLFVGMAIVLKYPQKEAYN